MTEEELLSGDFGTLKAKWIKLHGRKKWRQLNPQSTLKSSTPKSAKAVKAMDIF